MQSCGPKCYLLSFPSIARIQESNFWSEVGFWAFLLNGNPLQYSCLENPMDRGALWATVHQSHDWATSLSLLFQIDPNVCKGLGENWGRPGLSHVIQHGKSNALNMEVSKIAQLIKNPPAMRERPVWFLGWEDSPGEGIGYPLQYSWASLVA